MIRVVGFFFLLLCIVFIAGAVRLLVGSVFYRVPPEFRRASRRAPLGGTGRFRASYGRSAFNKSNEIPDGPVFEEPLISAQEREARAEERRQCVFLENTFMMLGILAKCDGLVSKDEITLVDELIGQRLELDVARRREAIEHFRRGKATKAPIGVYADAFFRTFADRQDVVRSMFEVLFQLATADGTLGQGEEVLLREVAGQFQITDYEFSTLRARYLSDGRAGASGRPRGGPTSAAAYEVLGVERSTPISEVKKRYRKLVLRYHPDRLAAERRSASAIGEAAARFRQVQEAYDAIVAERTGT